jgi:hypothetical protein
LEEEEDYEKHEGVQSKKSPLSVVFLFFPPFLFFMPLGNQPPTI